MRLGRQIGDVRITRVQEFEAPGIGFILPEATRENLATIDWIGVQETGGGGQLLPVWFVGGLAALRAAPFVAWRISRRLARVRRGGSRPGEPQKRP